MLTGTDEAAVLELMVLAVVVVVDFIEPAALPLLVVPAFK